MIKAKYDLKSDEMNSEIKGEANTILNEYMAITQHIYESFSINIGKDATKKLLKKVCKLGIKKAELEAEKEGKENE